MAQYRIYYAVLQKRGAETIRHPESIVVPAADLDSALLAARSALRGSDLLCYLIEEESPCQQ